MGVVAAASLAGPVQPAAVHVRQDLLEHARAQQRRASRVDRVRPGRRGGIQKLERRLQKDARKELQSQPLQAQPEQAQARVSGSARSNSADDSAQ